MAGRVGEEQRSTGTGPAVAGMGLAGRVGEEQRSTGAGPVVARTGSAGRVGGWRGAAPRWDEPSGGGNGRGARAGEEQRSTGTCPVVAKTGLAGRVGGWRGAAPRWDEPSGGGNGRGARAGEEQRPAGTSPNGVDLRPHAGVPRPVATSAYTASTPRRGLSPSSVAPRQQRSQPGRRHNGACPRWAMLLAQRTSVIWRGAAPRWDKPSGGGNRRGARAGEEQRPAGTTGRAVIRRSANR